MPKSVKIIIAAVSIITVGFFTVVDFLMFGFFGWVTVSALFGKALDSPQSRIINSMPEYSDENVYFFGARDGVEYIEFYYDNNFSSQEFEDNEYFKKVTESDFEIIYEDHNIIVVNKKAGLLTISTENEKINTLYHKVSQYVKSKNKIEYIIIKILFAIFIFLSF